MQAGVQRKDAKQYLKDHKIPQIFESLLSCLMMERPDNPVDYVEKRLQEIKNIGADKICWETLVTHLHPYRDDIRRQFVRDGSLFDKEFSKLQGEIEEYNLRKMQAYESLVDDDYTPEVFQLTEPTSWRWMWSGEALREPKQEPQTNDLHTKPAALD